MASTQQPTPEDMVAKIMRCANETIHCLTQAVLIDDKDSRLKFALDCRMAYFDCVSKAMGGDGHVASDIAKLRKALGRV